MGAVTESLERILALRDDDGRAVADLVALAIVRKALGGNLQAARLILEHFDGRPESQAEKRAAEAAENRRRMEATLARMSTEELRALANLDKSISAPRGGG